MTVKLDEIMRRAKKGEFAISELEVEVYAQREAGVSCGKIAQGLGLSNSYVCDVYRSAVRKVEAKARLAAHPKRIDFIN